MATELEKLLAERENLDKKIAEAKNKEREPVIQQIKSLIELHSITPKELGFKLNKAIIPPTNKVPAIYRNENGLEWSGRGRTPAWMKDDSGQVSEKLKKKYLIK